MFSKPLAVGVLGLACVSAAAGGAHLAVRQNEAPAMAAAASAVPAQPAVPDAVPDTEAVVQPSEMELPAATPAPDITRDEASLIAAPAAVEQVRPAESTPSARRAPGTDAVGTTPPAARPVRNAPATLRTPVAIRTPPVGDRSTPAADRGTPTAGRTARVSTVDGAATRAETATTPAADESEVTNEPAPAAVETPRAEPVRTDPVPPAREFVELEVPSTSVLGLRIETPVSSQTAQIEDRVEARVLRDVAVDGRTAIPAGTRVLGAVTMVERGGKVKERARLEVRFHTLVLADGSQLPLRSDTIIREGESPAGSSARKIGGAAVGGAILGALIGGKKGAIVGSTAGAAGGTAVVMAGDRNNATLPSGAVVTVRLSSPLAVEVEKR